MPKVLCLLLLFRPRVDAETEIVAEVVFGQQAQGVFPSRYKRAWYACPHLALVWGRGTDLQTAGNRAQVLPMRLAGLMLVVGLGGAVQGGAGAGPGVWVLC